MDLILLPHDAMHKRGLCRHAVSVCLCLSVCVSVCLSLSWIVWKRINISSNVFPPSCSQAILVFQLQTAWQYSDGNPPNGGVECRWDREKSRFWAYIWLKCLLLTLQQAGVVNTVAGGPRPPSRKLWHIAGSKRRRWLWEKTTKCLWQEVSTLRQRQHNSALNCTQW